MPYSLQNPSNPEEFIKKRRKNTYYRIYSMGNMLSIVGLGFFSSVVFLSTDVFQVVPPKNLRMLG